MYQKRERFGVAQRRAESGFWKRAPWRSLALGCALLAGGVYVTSPLTMAQFNGVAQPRQGQPGQYGNQYTPPGHFPPLPQFPQAQFPPLPSAPQAMPFSPAPMQAQPTTFPPLPTVPQMTHFPPVPIMAPPKSEIIQVQAAGPPPILGQGGEPPVGKQPEKVPGANGGQETLTPPRPVKSPFGPTQVRMPLMSQEGVKLLGTTPIPNIETITRFKQYVERFVDPENTLDLIESRVRLIILKETPKRIQMGDDAIAMYNLVTPKELTLIGRATGSTVLNMWFVDETGKETILSYLVRVFPDPEARERLERVYKALELEINREFPNSVVHLRLIGDKILVTGQAYDSIEATNIIRFVRSNSPGAEVNPRIPVDGIDAVVRQGDPLNAVPGLGVYGLHSQAQIVNMLRIPGEQMIMVKVVVAEVNRTAARSIGLNFSMTNNRGNQIVANLTGGIAPGNIPVLLDNAQISLAINALKALNYARVMTEPNLTVLNGMPAFFRSGGQFPVPMTTAGAGVGLQGTTFVPFGVLLNITPYITDKDRVRLNVNGSVSTRDITTGANIGGSSVPGLTDRTFATTVELRDGQTLPIAGMIQNNLGADRVNVPFFADIPIINRLTGVDKTSYGEQELVILITPELVHPLEYKEVPPLPGSDIFEPTDCEFYLRGLLESRRGYDYRSAVMNDWARQSRSKHCEQMYIYGPTGHSIGGDGFAGPGFAGPGFAGPGFASPGFASPGVAAPGFAAPGNQP